MTQDLSKYAFFLDKDPNLILDPMTGALSKETLLQYCESLIKRKTPFCFCFIDFDDFKKVNDTAGHPIGDKALREVSDVIYQSIKGKGVLGRFGGDEFVAVCEGVIEKDDAWQVARDYTQAVRNSNFPYLYPVFPNGRVTLTSGVSRFPNDASDLKELLSVADKALYRGKTKGKNCFIVYDKELHKHINVEHGDTTLEPIALIRYCFQEFGKRGDPLLSLSFCTNMLGNYYKATEISYVDESTDKVLFNQENLQGLVYSRIEPSLFLLEEDLSYAIYYRSQLSKDPRYQPLWRQMASHNVGSILLFRMQREDGKAAFLRIDSRRERIWSEAEILVYSSAANLFSLLNHVKRK